MRRYHIQDREDYHRSVQPHATFLHLSLHMLEIRYNKLCGSLRSLAHRIALLPPQDSFRSRMEGRILSKLYDMGVLNSQAKFSDIDNKLTVSAFCRRRLAVIMVTSKMAETVSAVSLPPLVYGLLCSSKIRQSNLLSKVMSVLDPTISRIRLTLSHGEYSTE
jgi:U3 small nucleolar ribonucleoprotein protein IMP3